MPGDINDLVSEFQWWYNARSRAPNEIRWCASGCVRGLRGEIDSGQSTYQVQAAQDG